MNVLKTTTNLTNENLRPELPGQGIHQNDQARKFNCLSLAFEAVLLASFTLGWVYLGKVFVPQPLTKAQYIEQQMGATAFHSAVSGTEMVEVTK